MTRDEASLNLISAILLISSIIFILFIIKIQQERQFEEDFKEAVRETEESCLYEKDRFYKLAKSLFIKSPDKAFFYFDCEDIYLEKLLLKPKGEVKIGDCLFQIENNYGNIQIKYLGKGNIKDLKRCLSYIKNIDEVDMNVPVSIIPPYKIADFTPLEKAIKSEKAKLISIREKNGLLDITIKTREGIVCSFFGYTDHKNAIISIERGYDYKLNTKDKTIEFDMVVDYNPNPTATGIVNNDNYCNKVKDILTAYYILPLKINSSYIDNQSKGEM